MTGFLGADQTVALRWQGKVAEVARKALLTVDSTIAAQITPTVIKYTSKFHYEIVQGNAAQLTLTLPAAQALTRLEGEQIRDWHTTTEGDHQMLTIEFIKPVENAYDLTLYSEQAVGGSDASVAATLNPPQPLNVERESGSLTVSAEDTLVEIDSLAGLRQVNAPDNAVAAYRFNARPFTLALELKPIEPVITVADRVNARLEETRLVVAHSLALNVEKAGIYTLELTPPAGFAVADVRGDGIEDWKVSDGKMRVNFSARVLGPRRLEVQLEQALKTFPEQISVAPLRVTGAAKETAQIGAASAPGIRLQTGTHFRPARNSRSNRLPDRADEILAYTAEQPDWQLSIASERLAARVVADVFNLVTIGDGLVGGSATIRYGLVNQGVQEFKVRVPAQLQKCRVHRPEHPAQGTSPATCGRLVCRTRSGAATRSSSLTIINLIPRRRRDAARRRHSHGGRGARDRFHRRHHRRQFAAQPAEPRATRCGAWTKPSCPPPTVRSSPAPSCWPGNTPATNTTWHVDVKRYADRTRCSKPWPTARKSPPCSPKPARCSRRRRSW